MSDVTRILNAIERGDAKATDELLPLVYEELRLLAAQKLCHELPGQTLQATALVHEAYIRLVESEHDNWQNRGHFFAAAAEAMRRILVENARRKRRLKRGGGKERLALAETMVTAQEPGIDRYFAGLSTSQAADVLNISLATANRHWSYARSWLFREISKGE